MAESLRDQLLKSGLVQKLKVDAKPKTPVAKPPAKPAHAWPQRDKVDLAKAYAMRAQQERAERERLQREAEQRASEKKERRARLVALLDGKALNDANADVPRHFPHGDKIRRIYCTADQLARLNRGDLAVVQLAGRYLLVERTLALQAQAVASEALVLLCDPNAPADDDVPADMVW